MEIQCDAILKDPFYKGSQCKNKAKYRVKLEEEKEYNHYRCGTHSKKQNKIELKDKKKSISEKKDKYVKQSEESITMAFEELLKYIEEKTYKKDEPKETRQLCEHIDNLNCLISQILSGQNRKRTLLLC